jgi:FtsP/CotA-like multicopper oxidase with cupredoxin domain
VLPGLAAALASVLFVSSQAHAAGPDRLETVVANDNTRAAGVVDRGTVMIRVRAARGRWAPEGPDGPVLTIEAFGEEGSALTVPAPLIRIVEGTIVAVSLRNDLDAPLRVYGLCTRDGGVCAPLDVPPGVTRDVRFSSGRAGTYHYWATSMGSPIPTRELAGAFVVDPPGGSADPDRIFVITEHAEFHRPSSSCSPAGQPERRCPEHTALSRRSSWRSSGRGCSS